MKTNDALGLVVDVLIALRVAVEVFARVAELIRVAQGEGRDLTDAELDAVKLARDDAIAALSGTLSRAQRVAP
jgi:phage I-like protein